MVVPRHTVSTQKDVDDELELNQITAQLAELGDEDMRLLAEQDE